MSHIVTYTVAAVALVAGSVVVDTLVLRTVLLRRRAFWAAYAIVLFFQLVTNAVLTGLPVVRYNPDTILGARLAYAPIEDVAFGFAMVLATLSTWVALGRSRAARPEPRFGPDEVVPPPPGN